MTQRAQVHLRIVLAWNCPSCGTEFTHRGKEVTDPELIEDAAEDLGSFEAGDLMEAPRQVVCVRCDEVYDVAPPAGFDD